MKQDTDTPPRAIAIIGSGPAGLIAAEVLAGAGHRVTVYERLASPARKFLMAGRGGLNLTHSEPLPAFLARYPGAPSIILDAIAHFPPEALIAWAHGLGIKTFTGSSDRVFPEGLKASPLLRAWLQRLASLGVELKTRHLWTGWNSEGALTFTLPDGTTTAVAADATLLALGGASWPRLGTDGSWTPILEGRGVAIKPLKAANAGVLIPWSDPVRDRFAGTPLKRIAVSCGGQYGAKAQRGEAVIKAAGLEGGAVYAVLPEVRAALEKDGVATLTLDLRPDESLETLTRLLAAPRGKESLSNILRKRLALTPAASALLREPSRGPLPAAPEVLAALVKAVPLTVTGIAGLERAISTAGGIELAGLDGHFMLNECPGVFAAGEMLDWEAPTGGYLLQACFATGAAAARGIEAWCAALASAGVPVDRAVRAYPPHSDHAVEERNRSGCPFAGIFFLLRAASGLDLHSYFAAPLLTGTIFPYVAPHWRIPMSKTDRQAPAGAKPDIAETAAASGAKLAARLDQELAGLSSLEARLAAIAKAIPGRIAFSTSLGIEDQAVLHGISAAGVEIDVFTLDTGRHFPETLETLEASELRYGRKIRVVFPEAADVEALVARDGIMGFRTSIDARKACCDVRKVRPLNKALAGASAWITGLRRDQSAGRAAVPFAAWDSALSLMKLNPIADWTLDVLEAYIAQHKVPVNELHAKGFPSIGCQPCTRAIREGEDIRAGRWWWENEDGKECGLHNRPKSKGQAA